MMSSSCKSSIDCVGSHGPVPVRATYVSLYRWPESDAEFVRSVTKRREAKANNHQDINTNNRWRRGGSANSPAVVDSYSCRQVYLRSYTFSRKESARERTRRCLVRMKERAWLFAFPWRRRRKKKRAGCKRNKRSKKSSGCGGCFVHGEIKKVYCAALESIFHGVVSCSTIIIGLRSRRCAFD